MLAKIPQLLNSWLSSLKLLNPFRAKLFYLVTLKTIVYTYAIILKKFWWLIGLCCLADGLFGVLISRYGVPSPVDEPLFLIGLVISIGAALFWCLFYGISFLACRPSLARKDYRYFMSYWRHFLLFLFVWVCLSIVFLCFWAAALLAFSLLKIPFSSLAVWLSFMAPYISLLLVSWYYVILALFFSLDCQPKLSEQVKAFYRSLKMIVFNYPFFLVLSLLSWGVFFGIQKAIGYCCASLVIENPQIIGAIKIFERDAARLVVPLFLSIANNFYIKEIHEQFKRYYPR